MEGGESEPTASVSISEELHEWLEDEAAQQDISTDELANQILAAHRTTTEDTIPSGDITLNLDSQIEELRTEFRELVTDVRERIIQLEREADAKAPSDHDHPQQYDDIKALEDRLDSLEERSDPIRTDLTTGFQNYEDVLEYLVETTDELEARSETLAQAILSAREQLREIIGDHQRREAVTALQRIANRKGVEDATCENCGKSVRVSLLTEPKCPHCSQTFTDIAATAGLRELFGTATLQTGDRPALTGDKRPAIDETLEASLKESGRESANNVDWGSIGGR